MTLPPGRARLATRPAATGSTPLAITIGMVVVAFLAANAAGVDVTTIRSTLRRTKSAASSGRRSGFCLGKPVLDGDILSLNPSKLAQLLPERLHEDRATGSSAIDPGNLCGGFFLAAAPEPQPRTTERDDDCKKPRPFSILDTST